MLVRALEPSDWPEVARIYAEGLASGVATFETQVPSWEEWDRAHLGAPRLVAERDGAIAGWVAVWGTLRLARTRSFTPFVIYRVVLGIVVLVVAAGGWR